MSPQAKETKEKINNWNYIKLKSFCKVHKDLLKLNTKKHNPIKKWAKDLNGHFSKKNTSPKCIGHTDGQYEKMLNITNHQRDAN